jgi:hypothetical protein
LHPSGLSCALLQRFNDFSRFGIDQRLIVNEGRRSQVRGIRLDRFRHARHGVALLGGKHTLKREYRLGECDAGCVGGLLQRDLRDHLVQLAPAGKLALHIVREGLERPGRQGKRDREQFSLAQDIEHTLVLAQLALTLAAAELVIRAVLRSSRRECRCPSRRQSCRSREDCSRPCTCRGSKRKPDGYRR